MLLRTPLLVLLQLQRLPWLPSAGTESSTESAPLEQPWPTLINSRRKTCLLLMLGNSNETPDPNKAFGGAPAQASATWAGPGRQPFGSSCSFSRSDGLPSAHSCCSIHQMPGLTLALLCWY